MDAGQVLSRLGHCCTGALGEENESYFFRHALSNDLFVKLVLKITM